MKKEMKMSMNRKKNGTLPFFSWNRKGVGWGVVIIGGRGGV